MSAEEVVQRQLDYYNAHDLDRFVETFHEDVEVLKLIEGTTSMKGREEFRERYAVCFERSRPRAELVNRIVIGNKVIDHEDVIFADRDGPMKAVAIYEVEGEQIKRVFFLYE